MQLQTPLTLGKGSFAVAEKAIYDGKQVAVKRLTDTSPSTDKSIFAKEALLLKQIDCANIVKLISVSDDPMAVMLEYCEFSFKPFNRESSVNSLDQFLSYLDGQEHFAYFPSICNKIVEDMPTAVDFLHNRDIVHRDIKPANVLVSNLHYTDLKVCSNEVFMSQPIVCKLAAWEKQDQE